MVDVDRVILRELARVAPFAEYGNADWADVVRRTIGTGESSGREAFHAGGVGEAARRWARPTRRRRRVLVIAAVAVLAIVLPLVSLAASQNWWFLAARAPEPTTAPVVVTTRIWAGKQWKLVAYAGGGDSICFGTAPPAGSTGGAFECSPFAMNANPSQTARPRVTITWLSGGPNPSYIAGPVVSSATRVVIVLSDGRRLVVSTFPAPSRLSHVRFYLLRTRLPRLKVHPRFVPVVRKLIGLNQEGEVVACLDVLRSRTSLATCR